MKNAFFALALIGFIFTGCNKEDDNAVPECIQDKLTSFDENVACPTGATVKVYTFQNKEVYVFNPGGCGSDLSTDVMDEGCTSLGVLGGILGETEIAGVEFYINAVQKRTIWAN